MLFSTKYISSFYTGEVDSFPSFVSFQNNGSKKKKNPPNFGYIKVALCVCCFYVNFIITFFAKFFICSRFSIWGMVSRKVTLPNLAPLYLIFNPLVTFNFP